MTDKPPIETMMLIMWPDKPHATRPLLLPRNPGFHKLTEIIRPILKSAFEHVSVLADFTGGTKYTQLDMFVDDIGKIKNLPRNEAATAIYRRANLMGRSALPKVDDPEKLNFIVGTAVLFDRRVWF